MTQGERCVGNAPKVPLLLLQQRCSIIPVTRQTVSSENIRRATTTDAAACHQLRGADAGHRAQLAAAPDARQGCPHELHLGPAATHGGTCQAALLCGGRYDQTTMLSALPSLTLQPMGIAFAIKVGRAIPLLGSFRSSSIAAAEQLLPDRLGLVRRLLPLSLPGINIRLHASVSQADGKVSLPSGV